MKTINTGTEYRFYDDSVKTYDKLPAQTYTVAFHPKMGFWLEKYPDFKINEKVYGVQQEKVNKVMKSFFVNSRSLGVILSGDKGIGKSLFAKMLGIKTVEVGLPLIIVQSYIPGIADFLNSIEEDAVVLFDEFDKTFGAASMDVRAEGSGDPQTEMLSLFDGFATSKKLFVITCNRVNKLSDYLLNRPGRFHYHFRFDYPNEQEIRTYLEDNIPESQYGEIEKVIDFAAKIELNYDCLRAIAFELSLGEKFVSAIKDLNILNTDRYNFKTKVIFENGDVSPMGGTVSLNFFDPKDVYLDYPYKNNFVQIHFHTSDGKYSKETGLTTISGDKLDIYWDEDYFQSPEEAKKFAEEHPIKCIIFEKDISNNLHYIL